MPCAARESRGCQLQSGTARQHVVTDVALRLGHDRARGVQGRAPRLLGPERGVGGVGREAGATAALQSDVDEGLENAPGRGEPFAWKVFVVARGIRMATKGSLRGRG